MWAPDPMLRGPGASARVILVLNQNRRVRGAGWTKSCLPLVTERRAVAKRLTAGGVSRFPGRLQAMYSLMFSIPKISKFSNFRNFHIFAGTRWYRPDRGRLHTGFFFRASGNKLIRDRRNRFSSLAMKSGRAIHWRLGARNSDRILVA